ncbi:MAG: asparagine--tRNA ligase [Desulfobacterales bacterium]|nr:asparagine--tRNA ligase [Desulfobacterales bacterium]
MVKFKHQRSKIDALLSSTTSQTKVMITGWLKTRRISKECCFLEMNDGSCLANIQVVVDPNLDNYSMVSKVTNGSALVIQGDLVPSKGKEQQWEIMAHGVEVIHLAPETYPLQKKRHTDEFLRTIAHLRPRTNKYGAMFRIRSAISYAIHSFFNEKGFCYLHTPIITSSDCEGAGQMFQVTTLSFDNSTHHVKNDNDFFGKTVNLTVSGQLSAEMFALALGDVYTFGPTFRAENSNTRRHAAEFWMIEPEMAFCDINECMNLAEEFITYLIHYALTKCKSDMSVFIQYVDPTVESTLNQILSSDFERIPYTEAIDILNHSKEQFEYKTDYGQDLQTEHERYLTEVHFKKPVIVYNYPESIKPFYMRLNNDGKTVAAMDVLVPRIGELIGGSQREERLDVLLQRMEKFGIPQENYWWYLDSRRYGSVPHSGFGLGFERLLMLLTGINNIRDVIPFPRTPGAIEF